MPPMPRRAEAPEPTPPTPPRVHSRPMRLVRLALQVVLFFLLLGTVVAIGAADTGPLEKLVLAVAVAGLVWLAALVRRIGAPRRPGAA